MAGARLRISLRAAIRCAANDPAEVVHRNVRAQTADGPEHVNVIVQRIADPESLRGLLRVSLVSADHRLAAPPRAGSARPTAAQLPDQMELHVARETLRYVMEELHQAQDDLRSTTQALASAGEALQTTGDDIETYKQDLAALHEELQCANAELQAKFAELTQVNAELENLMSTTSSATLFLDQNLRIKRHTPRVRGIMPGTQASLGSPFSVLAGEVCCPELTERAQQVLDTALPHEAEIQTANGSWLWVRMLPDRTSRDRVDGVAITFVDIDRWKRSDA
jgi:two-component system CheB/CheR fusion protein